MLLNMSQIDIKNIGKRFKLYCNQCKKHYIILTLTNASVGYFYHWKLGNFDARNQVYLCESCKKHK